MADNVNRYAQFFGIAETTPPGAETPFHEQVSEQSHEDARESLDADTFFAASGVPESDADQDSFCDGADTQTTLGDGCLSPVSTWTDILTHPSVREDMIAARQNPPMRPVNADALPQSLRAAKCWLHWQWHLGQKSSKWTKIPVTSKGKRIDAVDREEWRTIEELEGDRRIRLAAIQQSGTGSDALGFAFAFDGGFLRDGRETQTDIFWGVDIDNCAINRRLLPGALRLVQALGTYAEISPTGTGIKLIFKGRCPLHVTRIKIEGYGDAGEQLVGGIDIKTRGFFTITGERCTGSRDEVHEASPEVLSILFGQSAIDDGPIDAGGTDVSRGGRFDNAVEDYAVDPEARAAELARTEEAVRRAIDTLIEHAPEYAGTYNHWVRVLMAVKSAGFDDVTTLEICDKFSQAAAESYKGIDDVERVLWSLNKSGNATGAIRVGSLFFWASQHGFEVPREYEGTRRTAAEEFGEVPLGVVETWDLPSRVLVNMHRLEETAEAIFRELGRYGWPICPEAGVPGISAEPLPMDRRVFVGPLGDLSWVGERARYDLIELEDLTPRLREVFGRAWEVKAFHRDLIPGLLGRVCDLQAEKTLRGGTTMYVPTEPKDRLIKHLACVEFPPHIRKIKGVIQSPAMVAGGRLITEEGYDEPTGLLYHSRGLTYDDVDRLENPTQEDARQATLELIDLLRDYNFDALPGVGPATWLAGLLTVVGRDYVGGRYPVFAFDAPRESAGKSKLVKLICCIANTSAVNFTYRDSAEAEKSLPLILRTSPRVLQFDNINAEFGGPTLESLLTEGQAKSRIITTDRLVEFDLTSVVIATGNRITFTQDMRRRTLRLRLITNSPNPERRTDFYYKDLVGFASEHRARLLVSALVILRAWDLHTKREGRIPQFARENRISNFERWCDTIRGAVMFADPGPPEWAQAEGWTFDPSHALVSSGGEVSEVNQQIAAICTLIEAITHKDSPFEKFANKSISVRATDLIELRADAPDGSAIMDAYAALDEVLDIRKLTARELGRTLAGMTGRVIEDMRQLDSKVLQGRSRWFVSRLRV